MHSKLGVLAGMLPTRHSDMDLHCSWVVPFFMLLDQPALSVQISLILWIILI